MASYRLVALPGCGAHLQVHPLEDGVLAVPLFDAQHGLLELPLPGVGGLVRLLPCISGSVVGEQVQLFRLVPFGGLRLIQQLVGADAQAADQQVPVHNPVVEGRRRFLQIVGRGGIGNDGITTYNDIVISKLTKAIVFFPALLWYFLVGR